MNPLHIEQLLQSLSRGENLPHIERFELASYLLNQNKPIEDIVLLFKNLPDYDEQLTRHHLQYLAGEMNEIELEMYSDKLERMERMIDSMIRKCELKTRDEKHVLVCGEYE